MALYTHTCSLDRKFITNYGTFWFTVLQHSGSLNYVTWRKWPNQPYITCIYIYTPPKLINWFDNINYSEINFCFDQVGRIPFNEQIRNFQNTLDQITNNLGAVDVANAIGRSIFFVGMGSNDYLNNYLMPNYPTKNQYNGQQFADLLVQQYHQQLMVINFLDFTFFKLYH